MVHKYKRKFRRDRNDKLLQRQKKDPKKFWDFIKKLGGENRGSFPDTVTDEKGKCITEPNAVKMEWTKYFEDLLNPLAPLVSLRKPMLMQSKYQTWS